MEMKVMSVKVPQEVLDYLNIKAMDETIKQRKRLYVSDLIREALLKTYPEINLENLK